MKIDFGSLAFNININGKVGGTPSWGTAIVYQNQDNKIKEDLVKDILIGMIYKKIDCTSEMLSLPMGKGGKVYFGNDDFAVNGAPAMPYLAARFEKTYVNGLRIGKPFILLIVKDGYDAHNGRLQLKYSPKITWGDYKNQEFFDEVFSIFEISQNAPFVCYDISIFNQDELHFRCAFKENEYVFNDTKEFNAFVAEKLDVNVAEWDSNNDKDFPLQQIYYGAPGTGKSHTINRDTKGHMTFRTTFHPDSDYSTFVGAYKPVMEEVETRVVPVVLNNGAVFDQNCGTLKERRISYKFVKQTFMKAYIAAWRAFIKNSNVTITTQIPFPLSLTYDDQTWILEEVTNDKVLYTKEEIISVEEYKKEVLGYWGNMPDPDEKGKMKLTPFDHYKATACVWYREKYGKNHNADECWEAIMNVLEAGGVIEATPNSQTYSISLRGDKLVVVTRNNKTYRETIKKSFENAETDSSVHKRIAKELKEQFDANDFDNAWEQLKKAVNEVEVPESTNTTEVPPVFLIIEEINRGNCAQIFGDLFQLLDREKGFSQYPIHADEDIRKCLLSHHTEEAPSFGINGLEFTSEQKTLINSILDCEDDVAEKIARGEVLVLPPNLYIWATMNTSDQSLFPIDSAFKRRWDWEYMPIQYKNTDWVIKIDGDPHPYSWVSFQRIVNKKIFDATNSEDKMLGDYFVNPSDKIITEKMLLNKILFYLWNDVCKDGEGDIFKISETESVTFSELHGEGGSEKLIKMMNELKVEKFGKPSEGVDSDSTTEKVEE